MSPSATCDGRSEQQGAFERQHEVPGVDPRSCRTRVVTTLATHPTGTSRVQLADLGLGRRLRGRSREGVVEQSLCPGRSIVQQQGNEVLVPVAGQIEASEVAAGSTQQHGVGRSVVAQSRDGVDPADCGIGEPIPAVTDAGVLVDDDRLPLAVWLDPASMMSVDVQLQSDSDGLA